MIKGRKSTPLKRVAKYLAYTFLIGLLAVLAIALVPRNYIIPSHNIRNGTRYWDLKTGSHIAYYHIPSAGNKKPTPVIYLHGGPGGQIFDMNIQVLSSLSKMGYDVYLYDQIGCGASGRLQEISEYSCERHKRDLEEIVDKITSDKVILIGQSWGAVLSCLYTADNPLKVEKLILTGPGPVLPYNYSLSNAKAPDSLHLRQPDFTNKQGREKVYNLRAYVVETIAKTLDLKLAPDHEMDAFASVLSAEMSKSTVCDTSLPNQLEAGSGYYSMIKTIQSFDQVSDNNRAKLSQFENPVLILRGQCDGIPWGFVNEYTQVFRNYEIRIIPDAGHSIIREQPQLYIQAIEAFLK